MLDAILIGDKCDVNVRIDRFRTALKRRMHFTFARLYLWRDENEWVVKLRRSDNKAGMKGNYTVALSRSQDLDAAMNSALIWSDRLIDSFDSFKSFNSQF